MLTKESILLNGNFGLYSFFFDIVDFQFIFDEGCIMFEIEIDWANSTTEMIRVASIFRLGYLDLKNYSEYCL